MSTLPSPQIYEELRTRLSNLTNILFSHATKRFSSLLAHDASSSNSIGPPLLSLCRGPGRADMVLQQLSQQWPLLAGETQMRLRDTWEAGVATLRQELTKSCEHLGASGECSRCQYLVSDIGAKLESLAENIAERLEVLRCPAPQEIQVVEKLDAKPSEEIQNLKVKLADKDTENLKLDKDLKAVKDDKTKLQELFRVTLQQLDGLVESLDKSAVGLERAKEWRVAAEVYAEIHKIKECRLNYQGEAELTEAEKKDVKIDSVRYKHKQVSALMRLGTQPDEKLLELAEDMWELAGHKGWFGQKGDLILGANNARKLQEDYCLILRRNKKFEEAEKEYMLVWYSPGYWGSKDPKDDWRYDTAYRIGRVMAEQNKFEEAHIWHKKVMNWGIQSQPPKVTKSARSAVRLISGSGKVTRKENIIELLNPTWKAATEADYKNNDVLTCGYELGRCLVDREQENAASVLSRVFEERRSQKNKGALDAAKLLVGLYSTLDRVVELEDVYSWLIKTLPTDGNSDRIKYQYALGFVQFTLKKEEAETTLKHAFDELGKNSYFGKDNVQTMQCGLLLGQVLLRKGDFKGAEKFFKGPWDKRKKGQYTALTVMAGEYYSETLIQSGETKDANTAETILQEVWEKAIEKSSNDVPLDKELELWYPLLSAGDCYGKLLYERHNNPKVAAEVLSKVVTLRKALGNSTIDELENSQNLLADALQLLEGKKTSDPKPSIPATTPTTTATASDSGSEKPQPKRPKSHGVLLTIGKWMAST